MPEQEQQEQQDTAVVPNLTNLEHVKRLLEQFKGQMISINAQIQLLEQLETDLEGKDSDLSQPLNQQGDQK